MINFKPNPLNPARRMVVGAIASAALGIGATTGPTSRVRAQPSGSKTLVAYFTRTGNTRVIADKIRLALGTDGFVIAPATSYSEDYETTVRQAERERDSSYAPPLVASVPDIAWYDTVFLGFPVWGETIPPVIRSFLQRHDLAAKTLAPFLTHGGYGQGRSMRVIRQLVPRARILEPFVMEADQERRTIKQVATWLSRTQVPLQAQRQPQE